MQLYRPGYSPERELSPANAEITPEWPVSVAVVVLAAGAGRRMGVPKWGLRLQSGESFIERIVAVYAGLPASVVVVKAAKWGAPPAPTGACVVTMPEAGGSRVDSLRRGLEEVPADCSVFVQDVDRPFVDASLLRALLASRSPRGYTLPAIDGHGGHPLLLSPDVVAALKVVPASPTLREALRGFERTLVTPPKGYRDLNINTPEDYRLHVRTGGPS